jgi:putative photosynthetic complex assembly protein 2
VAAWTFLALWVMRLSTKFNVFLGVRNLNEGWLPEQLGYLQSYFSRSSMNPLFPFSVTAATVVSFLVLRAGFGAEVPAHTSTGLLLVGSLLVLGVLEHWFLILPVSIDGLFRWGFRSRERDRAVRAAPERSR